MNGIKQKSRTAKLLWAAGSISALMVSANALAQDALGGSDLVLPANAPSNADMIHLKTESGFNSFSVLVSNTGPVAVTGAVVTDTGGTGGICSKANPVKVTGDGVPEGSFTVANLIAPGIALGTLEPGQSATLTYACQGT